jgi:capsule biosynthesis phosphatase
LRQNTKNKMYIIILCGGLGTRLGNYSFPKPLNKIHGKYAIEYVIERLPMTIQNIHFIYSPLLVSYNFETVIRSTIKGRQLSFYELPYVTRGAVESAYIGTREIQTDENILFIDNDVISYFPPDFFTEKDYSFIGTAIDNTDTTAYSFVRTDDADNITSIEEKVRISNTYSCGLYGFHTIGLFQELSAELLRRDNNKELYMSQLYKIAIQKGCPLKSVPLLEPSIHIGSLNEISAYLPRLAIPKMRVCFDLDNTLVSYPAKPGDYTTVQPVAEMVTLARRLHAEGHTIIIHTARRMKTHGGNVGAVIKDIGRITFDTLEKFNIPYDEIIFGKPIADIYIDDRAVNPYINNTSAMGVFQSNCEGEQIINKLPNNRYNNIYVKNNQIIKVGPETAIAGEEYYYKQLAQLGPLATYYPSFYGSYNKNGLIYIQQEYIKGISFYDLYHQELLFELHMDKLLEYVDKLHTYSVSQGPPSFENVKANYVDKLLRRFEKTEDYPFADAEIVQRHVLDKLETYLSKEEHLHIVPIIHGDLWFSNIFYDFNYRVRVFDMRGCLGSVHTLGGDRLYDYGKIYQSILGYDDGLYGKNTAETYKTYMRELFEKKVVERGVNLADLKTVCVSLIIGTIPFIMTMEKRARIWALVQSLLD